MANEELKARQRSVPIYNARTGQVEEREKIRKADQDWQRILPPETYRVACRIGPEPPFANKYNDFQGESPSAPSAA